jgi:DNA-binding transcriptional ArsR family regulator
VTDVPQDTWLGRDDGPVVRPYALTGGRTKPPGETIGMLALVQAISSPLTEAMFLEPEQLAVLRLCRRPVTVADLASDIDLPLGVVRILLSDLRERGLITIRQPSARPVNDKQLLKDVADALRRL